MHNAGGESPRGSGRLKARGPAGGGDPRCEISGFETCRDLHTMQTSTDDPRRFYEMMNRNVREPAPRGTRCMAGW